MQFYLADIKAHDPNSDDWQDHDEYDNSSENYARFIFRLRGMRIIISGFIKFRFHHADQTLARTGCKRLWLNLKQIYKMDIAPKEASAFGAISLIV